MARDVETVPGMMTLSEISNFLLGPDVHHPSFPVIDGDQQVLGIVDPPTVLGWRSGGVARDATLAELFSKAPKPAVAYPDEYLDGLVERMMRTNAPHVPVVMREDSRFIGYLTWKNLLEVRTRIQDAERRPAGTQRVQRKPRLPLPSQAVKPDAERAERLESG